MICGQQQSLRGLQSPQKSFRHARSLIHSSQVAPRPLAEPLPATDRWPSSSNASSRPSVSCRAEPEPDSSYTEPEPVSGFTPADYISFSTDENKQCHHNAEVWVDAPIDVCYAKWSEWNKLLDFLDLIGQIGLDGGNPNMALFQCFYRFRKLPLMEIVFLLEREEEELEDYRAIHFKSVYGMPIKGQVQLSEQLNAQTRVRLYFTHPVPNLLVQLQIGPFGVETDMQQILKENMEAFKQQAEAAAPADWEQQKPGVIAKVQKVVEDLKIVTLQEHQERQRQEQEAQQHQEQEQQAEGASDQPQQQQQVQQPQPPAQPSASADPQQQPGAAGKRPRGRSTASKASAAAGDAGGAAAGQEAAPRAGRKTTRGRMASTAAAAAADDSSSGGTAAKRRSSRMASSAAEAADSSGNGTGPEPDSSSSSKGSGRRSTTRRTSKRSSTAAKE